MRDAVIVDCDGTLVEVSGILDYLEPPNRNFHKFHRESVNCPPKSWVVDEVVDAYNDGLAILIVTARVQRYWPETQFWLRHHLPVPYENIYMRADGDFRPDGVVKLEILDKIREDGYNVVRAWDDNPQVIKVWESQGIPVTVVPGWAG